MGLLRDASDIGLYVDYQYDEVTGLLKSSTDHKGRVTQNEYDEWGNLLVTYRPDGSKKQNCNKVRTKKSRGAGAHLPKRAAGTAPRYRG